MAECPMKTKSKLPGYVYSVILGTPAPYAGSVKILSKEFCLKYQCQGGCSEFLPGIFAGSLREGNFLGALTTKLRATVIALRTQVSSEKRSGMQRVA